MMNITWSGPSAHAWVDAQALIDRLYEPFQDALVDAVADTSPRRVLDVGCGTGGTTLAIARRLGADSACVGLDISEPMIAAARARAERERTPATFICADAQAHAFDAGTFDAIASRFGVMFFDDPVKAFANLRQAVKARAALRLVVWRSPGENPFMTTAEQAAAPLLPNLPPRVPDAPGQFGFADQQHVTSILRAAGWADLDFQPIDVLCTLPEPALVPFFTRFGPVSRLLPEVDERTRAHVVEVVRPAFDPYVHGEDVRFTAACWLIRARA